MNETSGTGNADKRIHFRPQFAIYHPNGKGTGCAMKMELHPAHDDRDGCIMVALANQQTACDRRGPVVKYATFDWQRRITVKLDFSDICKMMQVFRGESESIDDGKGIYHRSPKFATRIALRHVIEPLQGYSLEVYRSSLDKSEEDCSAHMFLTAAEAYGIAMSFEHSIGVICFGIPRVIPHDTSAYMAKVREMRDADVA